ncbi:MAG: hypothetical protein KBG40_04445 [Bacteroidales bacterium]|nr:hypothetical protein [Bacteroidales bacterium]
MSVSNLPRNLRNFPGWRISRRIVVIESDDWGSIRMPSNESFSKLQKERINLNDLDALRYNINDTLESSDDLYALFEVLSSESDYNGRLVVFTPVYVVANPDFNKIRESNFSEYFYEPFTSTLKKYYGNEDSFRQLHQGIEKGIFVPQFHGREHLNVISWMKALREGERQTRLAFYEGFWGFVPDQKVMPGVDFQAAFLLAEPDEIEYHKKVITDGLNLFEKLFGYRAEYFVPPNGYLNNSLNIVLFENGIKYRSAANLQTEPLGKGKSRKVFHWLGQKDKSGLIYMKRNCFFEPSKPGKDWIDSCLYDINSAFKCYKPAIISSHRVNYIGRLNQSNRDKGLNQLKKLLKLIVKNWPDVEFMTTPELGKLISSKSV